MHKRIRSSVLRTLKTAGIFAGVRNSPWRRRRLLILCYHGLALEQENLWAPALFLTADRLRDRLEMLKQGGYNVLPLTEGLERLRKNDLPPRSVVLTFDDGTYDFYKLAYPLLKQYKFPATVYQTTHYSSHPMPVFNLICWYMLWKKRDTILPAAPSIGIPQETSLQSAAARETVMRQLLAFAVREQFSAAQKNALAAEVASLLGVDYADLLRQRILQLMTPQEIAELASAGISFELHTHRHRMPRDRALFEREIQDNGNILQALTSSRPTHFCYPGGDYERLFLPWLAALGVQSATTCDAGLSSLRSEPLLLPRFVDTTGQTPLEFESWLTGVGALLSAGVKGLARRTPGEF
jgi:peptidoglycan/xylan/chitin deacetylase (PgdA/CDA1 family)